MYMKSFDLETIPCNLCGSDRQELVMKKPGKVTGHNFSIVRCLECGLVYVNPRLSPGSLRALYDEAYYRGVGFDEHVNYVAEILEDSPKKRGESESILANVRQLVELAPTASWLDVGCGMGYLMQYLKGQGIQVEGVEFSPQACQSLRERGLEVFEGVITDLVLDAKQESYDIITAIEVVEHLSDPMQFLKRVYTFLKPGGLFYFTTGNVDDVRHEGVNWGYFLPEGHTYYFSPKTMNTYFCKIGFDLLDPYSVYMVNRVFRVLKRLRLVRDGKKPASLVERVLYSESLRLADFVRRRSRFSYARKPAKAIGA